MAGAVVILCLLVLSVFRVHSQRTVFKTDAKPEFVYKKHVREDAVDLAQPGIDHVPIGQPLINGVGHIPIRQVLETERMYYDPSPQLTPLEAAQDLADAAMAYGDLGPAQQKKEYDEAARNLVQTATVQCGNQDFPPDWVNHKKFQVPAACTALSFGGQDLQDHGAVSLANALTGNEVVTWLAVMNNGIGVEGVAALADILYGNLTALTTLNLQDNEIGDDGAFALAEVLKQNNNLSSLHIGPNFITDEGAVALAEALILNTGVTTLDLRGNYIRDRGAALIGAALIGNKYLTTLDLSGNAISTQGGRNLVESITDNTVLTTLHVQDNNLGNDNLAALKALIERNRVITKQIAAEARKLRTLQTGIMWSSLQERAVHKHMQADEYDPAQATQDGIRAHVAKYSTEETAQAYGLAYQHSAPTQTKRDKTYARSSVDMRAPYAPMPTTLSWMDIDRRTEKHMSEFSPANDMTTKTEQSFAGLLMTGRENYDAFGIPRFDTKSPDFQATFQAPAWSLDPGLRNPGPHQSLGRNGLAGIPTGEGRLPHTRPYEKSHNVFDSRQFDETAKQGFQGIPAIEVGSEGRKFNDWPHDMSSRYGSINNIQHPSGEESNAFTLSLLASRTRTGYDEYSGTSPVSEFTPRPDRAYLNSRTTFVPGSSYHSDPRDTSRMAR